MWLIRGSGSKTMAYFNEREREELGNPATPHNGAEEYAPRPTKKADGQLVADEISALLHSAATTSVQQIESVIHELKTMRQQLSSEAARVQREMADYASLGQSAVNSAKVISESLQKSFPALRSY